MRYDDVDVFLFTQPLFVIVMKFDRHVRSEVAAVFLNHLPVRHRSAYQSHLVLVHALHVSPERAARDANSVLFVDTFL